MAAMAASIFAKATSVIVNSPEKADSKTPETRTQINRIFGCRQVKEV